ncbi:MAG: hypothetical protein J5990_03070 [Bacteroidales bacterium]|nr:hypothetical protein [Bacteroidales bacterium]
MNELPVIEAYSRPDRVSILYVIVIFILGLIVLMSIGDCGDIIEYLFILGAFIAVSVILVIRSRRMKRPVLRIYEDRIERRFLWQKEYKRYYFEELSSATLKYEFPMYDVLRLEFRDARKPVMIQMSNLSVAVEDMYRSILERI